MSIEDKVRKLNGGTFSKKSYSVEEVQDILGITRQTVCTHGKGDCRKCGFGGRGRTTIPNAAACSFSAFSRSYLSPKCYAPADGQTVNLGINFGIFSLCKLRLENGRYCGMGKSLRRVLCAFGRGHLLHFWI